MYIVNTCVSVFCVVLCFYKIHLKERQDMSLSEAQRRANEKWNKENIDRIQLVVRRGQKQAIKSLADAHNESLNAYIVNAVKERAKSDGVDL